MITLRAATIDDVPTIAQFVTAAFDPRYGEAWNGTQLLGTMALPGTRADVALLDGGFVGFALSRIVVDEVELLLIAVDPAHRSQGIGSKLLCAITEYARSQRARVLHLEVRDGNSAAYGLYTSHSFTCVGRRKSYYYGQNGEIFDALTMSLAL